MGEKGSLKLHPPWRSWLLRILSVYYRRLLFSAGVKWSLKLHFRLRSYLLRILSVFHRRLLFSAGVKLVSKTALSFALVPSPNSKRVSSSSPFFCWGKMLSKIAPSFAHVVTGTFSEFLACITVVFLFCLGEMVSKTALSFALVPSPNS